MDAPRRPATSLTAILGGLALAVVAAASAWLARDSWGRSPSAAPTASSTVAPATPSGTPFAVQAPPAAVPLLWFERAEERSLSDIRLHALSWSGQEVGTLAHNCLAPCTDYASPDGRLLLLAVQAQPSQAEVIDASGAHIGSLPDVTGTSWSSDSSHLCAARAPGGSTLDPSTAARVELDLLDPRGGPRRTVATVTWRSVRAGVFSGVQVSCFTGANRAVVTLTDAEPQGVRAIRILELSSGREVYARDDAVGGASCGCPVESVVMDGAGRLVVENLAGGGVRVRDTASGAVVPWSGPAAGAIDGMSWNARLAVAGNGITTSGVVDVSTGGVVWTAPPLTHVTVRAARPGGDDLLLGLASTTTPGGDQPELILHADGTVDHLPAGVAV